MWRDRRFSLLIVLPLIALTAWAGVFWWSSRRAADAPSLLAQLTAVPQASRPFPARLTGGFPHRPLEVRRSGATGEAVPADVRLLAARLEKRLETVGDAEALADAAAGALLAGHTAAALDFLSLAREHAPDSARVLSDLAAAYLVRAESAAPQRSADLVRALEAAAAAVAIDARRPEAWFNRALAAERILSPEGARAAWDDYRRVDPSSPWAEEAAARLSKIEPPEVTAADEIVEARAEALARLVARDPQRAREGLLERVLPSWGRAFLSGGSTAAQLHGRAAAIADLLVEITSDPFARDVVAAAAREPLRTARGAVTYGAAREAYDRGDPPGADRLFARAAGELTPFHPLRTLVDLERARIALDRRDIAAAGRLLTPPLARAERAGHRAAFGRARWLEAQVHHRSNRIDAAIAAYSAAAAVLASAGERENELLVYTALADNLRLRGERQRSWTYVLQVLARSSELHKPLRQYVAYLNAALFAADEGWLHAALVFHDEAVRAARRAPVPGAAVEALTTRALVLFRLNREQHAEASLREAEALLASMAPDAYHAAEIDMVRGEGYATRNPALAETALTRALRFFSRAEPAMHARLLLLRARVRRTLQNHAGAEADLDQAIRDVEHRRVGTADSALRMSYFDDVAELFTEMVSFQLSGRNDPDRAFEYLERGRARAVLDASDAPTLRITGIQQALPARTALIEFKVLADAVACWVITSDARQFLAAAHQRTGDRACHAAAQAAGSAGRRGVICRCPTHARLDHRAAHAAPRGAAGAGDRRRRAARPGALRCADLERWSSPGRRVSPRRHAERLGVRCCRAESVGASGILERRARHQRSRRQPTLLSEPRAAARRCRRSRGCRRPVP